MQALLFRPPSHGAITSAVTAPPITQRASTALPLPSAVDSAAPRPADLAMVRSCRTLARCAGVVLGGSALVGLGTAAVLNPGALPQMALGTGLLFGAVFFVRKALVTGAESVMRNRQEIKQLQEVQERAAHPSALATTVQDRPDVMIDILMGLKKEIIDKLAACSKTKIDWDAVLCLCEELLAELSALDVPTEHSAYQKLLDFKVGIELEIQKLARAAWDLVEHGNRIPAWIEGERVRLDQLQEQKTRAERLAAAQKKLETLVGTVEQLTTESQVVVDEVEQLTAEIKATGVLFQHVDALTEVDAWLALAKNKGLSEKTIMDLRERVAAKRKELVGSGVPV